MLFYGPPGTGKTSTILALAKELYGPELMKSRVLELNASDERGISIVREKVKDFARTTVSNPSEHARKNYPCPPYKIIILDEADSMTGDAQSALRRTMENYSKITRFCLVCNYVTRIIDPIASRCSKFRFKALDESNALQRLEYIAKSENVKHEPEALNKLLEASSGDLRKAITLLQSASKLGAVGGEDMIDDEYSDEEDVAMGNTDNSSGAPITVNTVYEISGRVPDDTMEKLVRTCRGEDTGSKNAVFRAIQSTVEDIVLAGWSAGQIVYQLHERLIYKDSLLNTNQKNSISWVLSEADKRLTDGSDEHLEILNVAMKVSKILN
ncbi:hypothetical protein TRICI_003949 [Trichomonascus ciferrii]|uniref:AAA+ ATPase domain-containing protein n=1 Tax=Trichomonascus ciferrii TaxID=44093 RepID=A0A642V3P9_9ASCO|nr:hypothetical protein TRICI_003949 [Trichomonascus ciferrii]